MSPPDCPRPLQDYVYFRVTARALEFRIWTVHRSFTHLDKRRRKPIVWPTQPAITHRPLIGGGRGKGLPPAAVPSPKTARDGVCFSGCLSLQRNVRLDLTCLGYRSTIVRSFQGTLGQTHPKAPKKACVGGAHNPEKIEPAWCVENRRRRLVWSCEPFYRHVAHRAERRLWEIHVRKMSTSH